jgi:hypothetical protein
MLSKIVIIFRMVKIFSFGLCPAVCDYGVFLAHPGNAQVHSAFRTAEHILVWKGKMSHIKIAFGTLNGLVSLILAAATICDIML